MPREARERKALRQPTENWVWTEGQGHLTFFLMARQYAKSFRGVSSMWKHNFMFRQEDSKPLDQSENDLYNDTEPALDSAGLNMEKFISIWIQGDGEDAAPTAYTNAYVRTASLDMKRGTGFWQPLQGRSHQIKQLLTPGQKAYVKNWLRQASSEAWEASEDHFRELFETE